MSTARKLVCLGDCFSTRPSPTLNAILVIKNKRHDSLNVAKQFPILTCFLHFPPQKKSLLYFFLYIPVIRNFLVRLRCRVLCREVTAGEKQSQEYGPCFDVTVLPIPSPVTPTAPPPSTTHPHPSSSDVLRSSLKQPSPTSALASESWSDCFVL